MEVAQNHPSQTILELKRLVWDSRILGNLSETAGGLARSWQENMLKNIGRTMETKLWKQEEMVETMLKDYGKKPMMGIDASWRWNENCTKNGTTLGIESWTAIS